MNANEARFTLLYVRIASVLEIGRKSEFGECTIFHALAIRHFLDLFYLIILSMISSIVDGSRTGIYRCSWPLQVFDMCNE